MRYSALFGKTLKETPSDATTASHRLLYQGGYIRELAAGRYDLLPLGFRVRERVTAVIRAEMEQAGGQQVATPTLHPIELWESSRRTAAFGATLMRVTDRRNGQFALGATHEEVMVHLVRGFNMSYRDLPLLLFQFTTKFRDELRPRGALLRLREFLMKDAYSFHAAQESLDQTYEALAGAYARIFDRLDVPAVRVEADSGAIGGKQSHEFIIKAAAGEDTVLSCPTCGYAANAEKATAYYPELNLHEDLEEQREVAAEGLTTIDLMCQAYSKPAWQMVKTVIYHAEQGFIGAVVRGDQDVNEIKLARAAGVEDMRQATDEEVLELGSVRGFISPVGPRNPALRWIADRALLAVRNTYTGANRLDVDLAGVTYGRDYEADVLTDIAQAHAGDQCPRCHAPLEQWRGIEGGHIFDIGTRYSAPMGAAFTDVAGQRVPYLMGCYGIGVDRLIAAIVECHHDEHGIVWPAAAAPFAVHLLSLGRDPTVRARADDVYALLRQYGLATLYDDRDETAGVKFADADLLGIPVRLTVSTRSWQAGGVEVRRRGAAESTIVSVEDAIHECRLSSPDALGAGRQP